MTQDRPPRAVLFDLDGTLLDTVARIREAWVQMLAAHGRAADATDWSGVFGSPLDRSVAVLADDPDEAAALAETYRACYRALDTEPVRAYPGVRAALCRLRSRGYRLGVVTNKRRPGTHRGLADSALTALIDVVVTAEDVQRHKPDPEPVRRALAALGAAPAAAWFVGDAPADLAAGRAAGGRTAAALWGPFERAELEPEAPDAWIATPSELIDLV